MTYSYTSTYLDKPIVKGRALDIFEPEERTQDKALFFTHGGGWTGGCKENYHSLMEAFCQKGFVCASCDYRLAASGITILDQVLDVRHAYDEFVSYLKAQNRPLKIVTIGSSAGAHLTQLLTFSRPGDCGEAVTFNERSLVNDWVTPIGCIPLCAPSTFVPWDDIFPGILSAMVTIAGCQYDQNPELYKAVSPDTYLSNITMPVYYVCASDEHIFPVRLIENFVEQINSSGGSARCKVYKNVEHGFFYVLSRWQQEEAFNDILAFIEKL